MTTLGKGRTYVLRHTKLLKNSFTTTVGPNTQFLISVKVLVKSPEAKHVSKVEKIAEYFFWCGKSSTFAEVLSRLELRLGGTWMFEWMFYIRFLGESK